MQIALMSLTQNNNCAQVADILKYHPTWDSPQRLTLINHSYAIKYPELQYTKDHEETIIHEHFEILRQGFVLINYKSYNTFL